MNRGLLIKAVREVMPVTLLCGVAMMVFELLLTFVLSSFQDRTAQLLQLDFVQNILKGLLGSEVTGNIGPGSLRSLTWVHPVVLALLWAHEITVCTRVPAGEVDRGTIDVLFGLPVSRWQVFLCESIVWIAAGTFVILLGVIGNVSGTLLTHAPPMDLSQITIVVVNLFCLYWAVGGLALLTSSLSDRRGRAVAVAFGIVVALFLLNFLAQFSAAARSVSFMSLLNYYRPLLILQESAWPLRDLGVLIGTGAALWVAAGMIFTRRDICTV